MKSVTEKFFVAMVATLEEIDSRRVETNNLNEILTIFCTTRDNPSNCHKPRKPTRPTRATRSNSEKGPNSRRVLGDVANSDLVPSPIKPEKFERTSENNNGDQRWRRLAERELETLLGDEEVQLMLFQIVLSRLPMFKIMAASLIKSRAPGIMKCKLNHYAACFAFLCHYATLQVKKITPGSANFSQNVAVCTPKVRVAKKHPGQTHGDRTVSDILPASSTDVWYILMLSVLELVQTQPKDTVVPLLFVFLRGFVDEVERATLPSVTPLAQAMRDLQISLSQPFCNTAGFIGEIVKIDQNYSGRLTHSPISGKEDRLAEYKCLLADKSCLSTVTKDLAQKYDLDSLSLLLVHPLEFVLCPLFVSRVFQDLNVPRLTNHSARGYETTQRKGPSLALPQADEDSNSNDGQRFRAVEGRVGAKSRIEHQVAEGMFLLYEKGIRKERNTNRSNPLKGTSMKLPRDSTASDAKKPCYAENQTKHFIGGINRRVKPICTQSFSFHPKILRRRNFRENRNYVVNRSFHLRSAQILERKIVISFLTVLISHSKIVALIYICHRT